MTASLHHVLVKRPGEAFGVAFDDPAHGFRRPVDLDRARHQHDRLVALLVDLGVEVHDLSVDGASPDLVYQYDPALVTDRGAILLRSGKPSRRGEEALVGGWMRRSGIPVIGAIDEPGTVDGGDVFWLRPDLVCVGRSLRTNQAGIDQLVPMLSGRVEVFDVPYDAGPDECLHLLSVISPLSDSLALVELQRLPSGLFRLLEDLEVDLVEVPAAEVDSLGCNVLVVRPGVAVMVEGNDETAHRLRQRGIEVHTFPGDEICWNGSGGPTCLTRPVYRR